MAARPPVVNGLLDRDDVRRWRDALLTADYTVDGVTSVLGLVGEAALQRGDLAGCRLALRDADSTPLTTLVRLFLFGDTVSHEAAASAFGGLPLTTAAAAGVLAAEGPTAVRAAIDVRPHGSDAATGPWWVVSDLGSDVRARPLEPDHVLGVGPAAITLAGVVPRRPVARALDVGTGSGVQALHLSTHSDQVVATDVSDRALRFAATSWELSRPGAPKRADRAGPAPTTGPHAAAPRLDLRRGSLLDPVAGDRFDLVVANPPFVISAVSAPRFTYRDGGRAGDDFCRDLVAGLPGISRRRAAPTCSRTG